MVLCNMCIVLFNANLTLCNALLVFSIFDKSRRNKCQEIWCEMLRGYKSLWSLPMHQPEHWHVAKNRPQGRFQVLQNSGIWMSKDVQVRVKTLSVGDCNWRNLRKYRALQYKSARASPLTGSTPRIGRVGRGAGGRWPAPRAPRPRAKSAPRAPRPRAPPVSPAPHDPQLTRLTYFAQGWTEDMAGMLENRAPAG